MENTKNLESLDEDVFVKDVYNEIGNHFNDTRAYTWPWIENFIQNYSCKDTVYDIGCGSGRNLKKSSTWIGIDNSQTFIDICKKKGFNVIQSDMTDIPLNYNTADAILSIASFHHLYTLERRIKALCEMRRLLKPTGRILLSVWSVKQPAKTRRTFTYGDNIVPWNQYGKVFERYYYIFKIDELQKIFHICGLIVESHIWDCGNEVFILSK